MTALASTYNGIKLDKPSHLSDAEWNKTTNGLKQSQGGRLFGNYEHKEPARGSLAVPDSPHIEFAADKAKRERKQKEVAGDIVE
jgi:hypothetical protein